MTARPPTPLPLEAVAEEVQRVTTWLDGGNCSLRSIEREPHATFNEIAHPRLDLRRNSPRKDYAWLTYAELSALSGVPKANLSRDMKQMRDRGFMTTVPAAKQNENVYGQLIVEGSQMVRSSAKQTKPRASLIMWLTKAGVVNSAAKQGSPSFSRSGSSTKIMGRPAGSSSRISGMGAKVRHGRHHHARNRRSLKRNPKWSQSIRRV